MVARGGSPLIAISLKSMEAAGAIGPHRALKSAVIRGQSTDRDAAFEIQTGLLNVQHEQYCRELGRHGFVVVEASSDWRYGYGWRDKTIQCAMELVHELSNRELTAPKSTGYDAELAQIILEKLNDSFPHGMKLIQLRYEMQNEPNDSALGNALAALSGDGHIDQRYSAPHIQLQPLQEIKLTKEGRRYIADMKSRGVKSTNYIMNDASQFILAQLLKEFRERKLKTGDLMHGYEGIAPAALRDRALAEGISEVDFDLAMNDLTHHHLVNTGPLEFPQNDPSSSIVWLIPFSKNEYSYLSKEGYEEASRLSRSPTTPTREARVHISGTFNNSPIGVGDGFRQTIVSQTTSIAEDFSALHEMVKRIVDDDQQREILSRIQELEAATDRPTMLQRYNNLVAAIGNHITVLSPLLIPLMEKLMH